ncbi:hypothetical protein A2U01_0035111, partial [Trifolium medium]|nr:hypothetical protein [Trifolium medium]
MKNGAGEERKRHYGFWRERVACFVILEWQKRTRVARVSQA